MKVVHVSPSLPRFLLRTSDDESDTKTPGRKTTRATVLPRIGRRQLPDNVVRRSPLPRLGYRKLPGERRSLPLPRIGRRGHSHWNLEMVFSRSTNMVHFNHFLPDHRRKSLAALTHEHWNLENDLSRSLSCAGKDRSEVEEKRPIPLPRMG